MAPLFFVSVASKGVRYSVSALESAVPGCGRSVDYEEVKAGLSAVLSDVWGRGVVEGCPLMERRFGFGRRGAELVGAAAGDSGVAVAVVVVADAVDEVGAVSASGMESGLAEFGDSDSGAGSWASVGAALGADSGSGVGWDSSSL